MFKVMKDRCKECLYGKNKIVSNATRAEILRKIEREDGRFECHKGTIAGVVVYCRGDWDKRSCGQLGRIAGRLNVVEFVAEDDLP